jgi:hypothetical protein
MIKKPGGLITVLGVLVAVACASNPGAAPQPSASPAPKASVTDVQIVDQGMGYGADGASLGAVFKDVNPAYAFELSYQATLYDAQGAQVGTAYMGGLKILPGETVAIVGQSFTLAATPTRVAIAPYGGSAQAIGGIQTHCAYRVEKPTQLPSPIVPAQGTYEVNQSKFASLQSGTVRGTLQVPSARQGLVAQAVMFDSAGHLDGFGRSDPLTTAQGPTPVLIQISHDFQQDPGLSQNPWGPVANVMLYGVDDLSPLQQTGVLGACQTVTLT